MRQAQITEKIIVDPELFGKLLKEAFAKYELNFWGKKVWVPYRTNLPYQEDRRRYGKWSANKIRRDVSGIAQEVGFDLRKATTSEIADFMRQQKLGIDCSGLVYQLYDAVLKRLGYGGMRSLGFGKASSVNVQALTSEKYSNRIDDRIVNFQPGDMIRFTGKLPGEWHVMLITEVEEKKIIYVHSSAYNTPDGVDTSFIEILNPERPLQNQKWRDILSTGINRGDMYLPARGDGIYRLKVLEYAHGRA